MASDGCIMAPQNNLIISAVKAKGRINKPPVDLKGANKDTPKPILADLLKGAFTAERNAFIATIIMTTIFFRKRKGSLTRL